MEFYVILVLGAPRGLPIYLRVRGSEISYTSAIWCSTSWKGTKNVYKGVQQGDALIFSTCIVPQQHVYPLNDIYLCCLKISEHDSSLKNCLKLGHPGFLVDKFEMNGTPLKLIRFLLKT